MANELHPEFDEETVRTALDELYQERWKGQRHALWGEQLSQAALTYALHAATMNRDRDPAATDGAVEWGRFDGGSDRRGSIADGDERPRSDAPRSDGGSVDGD